MIPTTNKLKTTPAATAPAFGFSSSDFSGSAAII